MKILFVYNKKAGKKYEPSVVKEITSRLPNSVEGTFIDIRDFADCKTKKFDMLVAIGGCSKEVPRDQLVERDGVKYEINSQTPFTGSSERYYDNGQLQSK